MHVVAPIEAGARDHIGPLAHAFAVLQARVGVFQGQLELELIADPQRRARMGAFGRARIENELEWRYEAPKLLAAYETLWR